MGYKYLSTELSSSSYIARGTGLAAGISFQMADYKDSNGKSYYVGDTYNGRYVKWNPGILNNRWGNVAAVTSFTYTTSTVGSWLPFASQDSCPMLKQDAEPSSWGNIRQEGPTTIYLSYQNEQNPSGPYVKGIWYSTDGTTWSNKKSGHSCCFVDLVAGGGGGGSCLLFRSDINEANAGGGGGGGAFVRVALDLEITKKVTITIGGGGSGGTGTSNDPGDAGSNSVLKTASGITITCGGGKGGSAGKGGDGGQVSSSLSSISAVDYSKGLLYIQPYHGKPGGVGGYLSYKLAPAGASGGAFIATDIYDSFGILATNKAVVKDGYHGYAGSPYAHSSYSSYEYAVQGGGAGASAIGGGYHSSYSGSHHGYGGGGNGASLGYTFKSWGSDEYSTDSGGCSGGNGACIIHYSYRSV